MYPDIQKKWYPLIPTFRSLHCGPKVGLYKMTLHLSVTGNENDDRLDKIAVYFNEASGYNTYVPRSVNIDLVGIIIRVTKSFIG